MSVDLRFGKKNRIRKIPKKMYAWEKTKVCDGLVVFQKKSINKNPAILILIPKAVIKKAVDRNRIRRIVREVFRKNISQRLEVDFLVKFNSCPAGFDSKLEEFFKNV
tara:strand:- start:232 stop:552 length:321 start_codon:yes stop_codon:yes gene_type:complete